ncbi:MAG TPA: hypothetical protein VK762_22985 [Polyangiaceae bacterium]|nr:hypothetical protein [Polyangiaceae bacterium]
MGNPASPQYTGIAPPESAEPLLDPPPLDEPPELPLELPAPEPLPEALPPELPVPELLLPDPLLLVVPIPASPDAFEGEEELPQAVASNTSHAKPAHSRPPLPPGAGRPPREP